MRRLIRVLLYFVLLVLFSCQIDIRPPKGHQPAGKPTTHHECLEKCKGLKGQDRAECNKECNRKYR